MFEVRLSDLFPGPGGGPGGSDTWLHRASGHRLLRWHSDSALSDHGVTDQPSGPILWIVLVATVLSVTGADHVALTETGD